MMLYSTVLLKFDVPNKNNRIYPRSLFEYLDVTVRVFGETVKEYESVYECSFTELNQISHVATNFVLTDTELRCDIEILDTKPGRDLKMIIERKCKGHFAPRGMGSIRHAIDGVVTVQDDYELIAFDFLVGEEYD